MFPAALPRLARRPPNVLVLIDPSAFLDDESSSLSDTHGRSSRPVLTVHEDRLAAFHTALHLIFVYLHAHVHANVQCAVHLVPAPRHHPPVLSPLTRDFIANVMDTVRRALALTATTSTHDAVETLLPCLQWAATGLAQSIALTDAAAVSPARSTRDKLRTKIALHHLILYVGGPMRDPAAIVPRLVDDGIWQLLMRHNVGFSWLNAAAAADDNGDDLPAARAMHCFGGTYLSCARLAASSGPLDWHLAALARPVIDAPALLDLTTSSIAWLAAPADHVTFVDDAANTVHRWPCQSVASSPYPRGPWHVVRRVTSSALLSSSFASTPVAVVAAPSLDRTWVCQTEDAQTCAVLVPVAGSPYALLNVTSHLVDAPAAVETPFHLHHHGGVPHACESYAHVLPGIPPGSPLSLAVDWFDDPSDAIADPQTPGRGHGDHRAVPTLGELASVRDLAARFPTVAAAHIFGPGSLIDDVLDRLPDVRANVDLDEYSAWLAGVRVSATDLVAKFKRDVAAVVADPEAMAESLSDEEREAIHNYADPVATPAQYVQRCLARACLIQLVLHLETLVVDEHHAAARDEAESYLTKLDLWCSSGAATVELRTKADKVDPDARFRLWFEQMVIFHYHQPLPDLVEALYEQCGGVLAEYLDQTANPFSPQPRRIQHAMLAPSPAPPPPSSSAPTAPVAMASALQQRLRGARHVVLHAKPFRPQPVQPNQFLRRRGGGGGQKRNAASDDEDEHDRHRSPSKLQRTASLDSSDFLRRRRQQISTELQFSARLRGAISSTTPMRYEEEAGPTSPSPMRHVEVNKGSASPTRSVGGMGAGALFSPPRVPSKLRLLRTASMPVFAADENGAATAPPPPQASSPTPRREDASDVDVAPSPPPPTRSRFRIAPEDRAAPETATLRPRSRFRVDPAGPLAAAQSQPVSQAPASSASSTPGPSTSGGGLTRKRTGTFKSLFAKYSFSGPSQAQFQSLPVDTDAETAPTPEASPSRIPSLPDLNTLAPPRAPPTPVRPPPTPVRRGGNAVRPPLTPVHQITAGAPASLGSASVKRSAHKAGAGPGVLRAIFSPFRDVGEVVRDLERDEDEERMEVIGEEDEE
ncbi:hypothetical protein GGF31_000974 [Allomyces arbusculus]|nr:hypothetical protein GGF31_000974 [Allomyces arbusculus]